MGKYGWRNNRLYAKNLAVEKKLEVTDSAEITFGASSLKRSGNKIVLTIASAGTCDGAIYVGTVGTTGGVLRVVK